MEALSVYRAVLDEVPDCWAAAFNVARLLSQSLGASAAEVKRLLEKALAAQGDAPTANVALALADCHLSRVRGCDRDLMNDATHGSRRPSVAWPQRHASTRPTRRARARRRGRRTAWRRTAARTLPPPSSCERASARRRALRGPGTQRPRAPPLAPRCGSTPATTPCATTEPCCACAWSSGPQRRRTWPS